MSTPRSRPASLRDALGHAGDISGRFVTGGRRSSSWHDLSAGTLLGGLGQALRGQSVVLATTSQMDAVAALIELDGTARRIVLYPPDLSMEHLGYVAHSAAAETVVSDRVTNPDMSVGLPCFDPSRWTPASATAVADKKHLTEWVLLTSGTTGRPKLVVHTLASLTGAIDASPASPGVVWSTFYDIRRYGGLQIFLRAALTGACLLLSSAQESTTDFLTRAKVHGVSHLSGTPSHWRRALMSASAHLIAPEYVRLSGEVADQGVLNQLHAVYPQARIAHAFATTEAGVVFAVNDGVTGFPAAFIENTAQVEMKIVNRSLHVRSSRTALCFLGAQAPSLRDAEGFVDTGDILELRDDRYRFAGRGDGMINVGGLKVYPEEVEAVINSHPGVQMSLVRTRRNPITGALVVADVVPATRPGNASHDVGELHLDILRLCRDTLASHKVPAAINFVSSLAVAETGKLIRNR